MYQLCVLLFKMSNLKSQFIQRNILCTYMFLYIYIYIYIYIYTNWVLKDYTPTLVKI